MNISKLDDLSDKYIWQYYLILIKFLKNSNINYWNKFK